MCKRTEEDAFDALIFAAAKRVHVFYPGTGATPAGSTRAVIRRGLRLAKRTQNKGYPLGMLRSNILKCFQHRRAISLGPDVALVERLTGLALRAGVDTQKW